jgi:hypothetical protein
VVSLLVIENRISPASTDRSAKHRAHPSLSNQHAVSIAVEPVLSLDCVPVRAQGAFTARKSANQRKQRGSWQMEIRQQRIDDSKRKSRRNE